MEIIHDISPVQMTKSSNNDQQSRLLYIYKHCCLCVSSVVEITKLYLFIYVPVFWLSIIFIHSNFPLLNILSRWTLKSYFHGECQQAQWDRLDLHETMTSKSTLKLKAQSEGSIDKIMGLLYWRIIDWIWEFVYAEHHF